MICSNCGGENAADALFCVRCGNKLGRDCSNCGAPLPPDAAFCPKCGTRVGDLSSAPPPVDGTEKLKRFIPQELLAKLEEAARSGSMQGERRTVTMLFCDVQGSTAAAEHLDPEEWADVMNATFERLIAPVYRYEGTLARLMGDAILAFFGAPIAHEDDAERAVLAGLEIVEAMREFAPEAKRHWDVDLKVRVGINTGLVVVGAVGSDLRVEYTAMGDAVNVASRMEQTAEPGTVRISSDTQKLVSELFEFEPIGPVEVKGRAEPIHSFAVVRRVERPEDLRGIRGMWAPMVGRDAELSELNGLFDAIEAGGGRIVSVMAEAGLGKSRLVREFRTSLQDVGRLDGVTWVVGRSLSYETSVPYAPVSRIIRRLAGLGDDSRGEPVWDAIRNLVASVLPGGVSSLAPVLGHVSGAPVPEVERQRLDYLEPALMAARATAAVVELFEALAAERPVVAVFEDLHWADSASIAVCEALMDLTGRSSLLLVLVFRPRRNEASWAVHERAVREFPHAYLPLELSPLGESDSRSLVSALLDIDMLPDPVRASILARSEGNPFFLEEVIRSMIEAGAIVEADGRWVASDAAGRFVVPDTLAAVINTRVDRLAEKDKTVLHSASVLGREFRYDELSALVPDMQSIDPALLELQRRELIGEVARVPRRVFRFRHALVQEAVYGTVLLKRRAELHAGAATFLEKYHAERVEDIADHFIRARLPVRALPHLIASGRRALRAYALPEAVERFAVARTEASRAGDLAAERMALEGLGSALEAQFDFAGSEEVYQRLVQLGEETGDLPTRISGLNKLAMLRGTAFGDLEAALQTLGASEEAARGSDDLAGLAEACAAQCFLNSAQAEFEKVEYYMGEVARLGVELESEETVLFGLTHLASTLTYLNRAEEGVERSLEALAKATEFGNLKFQADIMCWPLPLGLIMRDEVARAMEYLERGIELADRIGDVQSQAIASVLQGRLAVSKGAFEDGIAWFKRGIDAAEALGAPWVIAMARCSLGTCYQRIGGRYAAMAHEIHTEVLDITDQPGGGIIGTWIWTEIGNCLLRRGDTAGAERLFRRALEEKTFTFYLNRPEALRGLCELAVDAGDVKGAVEAFDAYRSYVEAHDLRHHSAPVALTGARLAMMSGDAEAALGALERASEILARHGFEFDRLEVLRERSRCLDVLGRTDEAAATFAEFGRVVDAIGAALAPELSRAFVSESSHSLGG